MNPKRPQPTPEDRSGKRPTSPAGDGLEELLARSKQDLLALAGELGLSGVSKLAKAELAKLKGVVDDYARRNPPTSSVNRRSPSRSRSGARTTVPTRSRSSARPLLDCTKSTQLPPNRFMSGRESSRSEIS